MGAIQGLLLAQYEVLRENGHSPSEAFNETVEELTQSLMPLFAKNGMDWMYANCSTTAQRGALDWMTPFHDAIKPVVEKLYHSVKTGNEAQISIDSNSKPDYREKLEEELKALQAMMNPHFLYNCLSSIKWKAIRSDQDDIAEITGLLATFYRTALNGGRQITIVQNELENIKAYLQIQLKSHENNFDVEYQLDEAGGECQMPNFLLQPIVENAICHGADLCESERGK